MNKIVNILFMLILFVLSLPLAIILKIKHKKSKVYIFGGFNGQFNKDNAYFLYKDFLKFKDSSSYYICDEKIESNFIIRNSIRSMSYLLIAEAIYISHSESDVVSYLGRLYKNKMIFIQHGVIGIKKLPDYERLRYYKFLCSHQYEEMILKKHFNVNESNIIRVALPRYKRLMKKTLPVVNHKEVFILLTWREKSKFDLRIYIENYLNLLKLLSHKFTTVKCSLHPAMYNLLGNDVLERFHSVQNIEYVKSDEIANCIITSDIFVTDYSSISWDFLYQNKPVIFYQLDYNDYVNKVGIYIQDKDFFGAVIRKSGVLERKKIDSIINESYKKADEFNSKYQFFSYDIRKLVCHESK